MTIRECFEAIASSLRAVLLIYGSISRCDLHQQTITSNDDAPTSSELNRHILPPRSVPLCAQLRVADLDKREGVLRKDSANKHTTRPYLSFRSSFTATFSPVTARFNHSNASLAYGCAGLPKCAVFVCNSATTVTQNAITNLRCIHTSQAHVYRVLRRQLLIEDRTPAHQAE